jgi:hypothetical protein
MAIIDDSKKNSFSHKPSKHQKDLTDGLKLKPMFNHLWTKSLSLQGQQLQTLISSKSDNSKQY